MKATVDQIRSYSFCPKLLEQDGSLAVDYKSHDDFTRLVTYCFRRDLELETKLDFSTVDARWKRIFFANHVTEPTQAEKKAYNRSVVAVNKFYRWYKDQSVSVLGINHNVSIPIYGHELVATVPILLHEENGISLVTTQPFSFDSSIRLDPAVRYVAMALAEEFKIVKICNLGLVDYKSFLVDEFIPTPRYWESSMMDFVGVMQSMHSSITYPNTASCPACPLRKTCEVLKGNA